MFSLLLIVEHIYILFLLGYKRWAINVVNSLSNTVYVILCNVYWTV